MTVYFSVCLFTVILCRMLSAESDRDYLKKLIIVFIPLFVFSFMIVGFRDEASYRGIYEGVHKMVSFVPDYEGHSEIGFQFLCYIMPSFRTLQVFDALLMCTSFVVFFYKNVPQTSLIPAIILLFLSGNYSIYFILGSMRNGIAISLLLIGFSLIKDRKLILFALLTLLASLFHTSALAAFPLAYIVGRSTRYNPKELFVWVAVCLFFILTSETKLISSLAPFIDKYFSRYNPVVRELMEVGDTFHPLAYTGALIAILFIEYFMKHDESASGGRIWLYRVSVLFPLSAVMAGLNARMNQYYVLFFIAAAALVFDSQPSKLKKVFMVFSFLYVGYAFYLWTQGEWFCYSQYHSILDTDV